MGRDDEGSVISDIFVEVVAGFFAANALGALLSFALEQTQIEQVYKNVVPVCAAAFIGSLVAALVCTRRTSNRIDLAQRERDKYKELLNEYDEASRGVELLHGIRRRLGKSD